MEQSAVVPVAIVSGMPVTVVHVAHAVTVGNPGMPTALAVRMVVSGMWPVLQGCRPFTHLHEDRTPFMGDGGFPHRPR